ncbi:hypothetical protein FKM82_028927 [Ascaphus truei]
MSRVSQAFIQYGALQDWRAFLRDRTALPLTSLQNGLFSTSSTGFSTSYILNFFPCAPPAGGHLTPPRAPPHHLPRLGRHDVTLPLQHDVT